MCLPGMKGYASKRTAKPGYPKKVKCRNLRSSDKVVGPVYIGPRGGAYFYVAGVRVYVPKGDSNLRYAKQQYGFGGRK